MEAAIDFYKMQRHITAAQNRILKSFSGLAALDQHEQWISQIQQSIKVQALPLIKSNGKDESGHDTKPRS